MSQPPPNKFGFQKPKTITVTSTRTSRIPGTESTRTDTDTIVTEVNVCSSARGGPPQPQASRLAAPTSYRQQQSSRCTGQTGIRQPQASSTLAAPPSFLQPPSSSRLPTQAAQTSQISRSIKPPSSFPQQQRGAIPKQPRAVAESTRIEQTSSLPASVSKLPSQIKPPGPASSSKRPSQIKPPAAKAGPSGIPRTSSLIPGSGAPPPPPDVSGIFSSTLKPGQVLQPPSKAVKYSKKQQHSIDMNTTKLQALQMVPPAKQTTEQKIQKTLLNQSIAKPGEKVSAKGKSLSKLKPVSFKTPAGNEQVLQKAVLEQRVERDADGERVVKNVAICDLNEETGQMDQVEIGVQQLDPGYEMMGGKDIVGVTSTVIVTPAYTTVSKDILRTVTQSLDQGLTMDPGDVAKLVEEEKEDVDNTLKMIQPDMVLSPGLYEKKQRLQQLRINPESIALLEESIIHPKPCADEPQTELRPEAMATVMYSVERGAAPEADPEQIFNSLFKEPSDEHIVELSSVSPGPLRDVVVPTEKVPKEIHQSIVTEEMIKLSNRYEDVSENVPYVDIFTRVIEDMKKSPGKGKNKPKSFRPIQDERSLWVNANLEHLVNIVGAEPAEVLDAADVDKLNKSGGLEKEMAEGVDYFLETDPLQYSNRVQLRGSQNPSYFPGYVVVSPELPTMIQVVKSPDEVFATAWKSVQPKYFADDSLLSRSTFL